MDEEQPKKKITLNNFFEQIVEIDKVANMALSNSNMVQSQLNAVQMDLKRLIESLQVNFDSGVQNVQNQINEVTNVIVQEQTIKKSETDALEEQVFAQEDQLQKQVKSKKIGESSFNLFKNVVDPQIQNQARANLLAIGLLGLGGSIGGLMQSSTKKDYEKNREKNRKKDNELDLYTEDKSQGSGFLSGFTEENVGDNAFGFGSPFDTDTVGDDAFGFGGFDSTEIIKNITDEKSESGKKQLLLMLEKEGDRIENQFELNKQLLLEKDVSSITAERNTVEEAINNLKLNKKDNKFGGNDYLQKLKNTTSIEPILNNISNIGDGGLFDDIVNSKEDKINVGDDGFGYGNFDTDIFKINDDTSNNVIDGGTTIIEGNNEVVNEDISSGQGRGEVATDVSIVKSSNSPVSAVAIAEGNSLNHLTI